MVGINIDANLKKCDKIWLIEHNDSQKEWRFIYFDAFSGKIKSELLAHDEGFFGVLTKLHESLFLGKSGHVILTLTAIFTFFICISGFVIYRKFWLTLLRLRVNRLNVFMSDIHKMIGIFSTPILLLICISGVWWEFQMARMPEFKNDFVIDAKIYNKSLSLDELVTRSKNDLAGFEPHFISLPFMQGANIRLFGYVKDQNFLHNEYSSILTYDKNSGELVSILDIKNANLSEEILSAFRKSYFGNYNQITKFIWF
ncbi:PepSY-associated TM helix domain-containing protein [Campylobacter concisus]|jgi:putative iron-regulated membrane protein